MRGHEDKRTRTRMMSKHQRGNVKADANCTAVKKGVRSKVRLLLPRRKSWRLCYDGVEMVGVLRKELREKMRTERLMGYCRAPEGGGVRQTGGWVRRCWQAIGRLGDGRQSIAPACVGCQDDVLDVADRGCGGTEDGPHAICRENGQAGMRLE